MKTTKTEKTKSVTYFASMIGIVFDGAKSFLTKSEMQMFCHCVAWVCLERLPEKHRKQILKDIEAKS